MLNSVNVQSDHHQASIHRVALATDVTASTLDPLVLAENISKSGDALPHDYSELKYPEEWHSMGNQSPSKAFSHRASLGRPDLGLVPTLLAQVDGVEAIYMSDSSDETHVWIIIDPWYDEILERIHGCQIELDEQFEGYLAGVDFHVLDRRAANRYKDGWRKRQLGSP